jgi:hypothetical protein
MTRIFRPLVTLLIVLFAASASNAAVDDEEYLARKGLSDRWQINFGYYLVDFDTNVRWDSEELGTGTSINLEDDLGLDDERSDLRIDSFFRFGRKHRLNLGYLFLGRAAKRVVLDEQIEFEGVIFDVGASVESDFDTQSVKVAYSYSFVNNGRVDFGISAGLSTFYFEAGIAGDGTIVVEGEPIERFVVAEEKLIAPVPVGGIRFEYTIRPRLIFRTAAQYFAIGLDGWEADLYDWVASIDYYPGKHIGFGVAYDFTGIRYIDKGSDRLEFNYDYSGLVLYLNLNY